MNKKAFITISSLVLTLVFLPACKKYLDKKSSTALTVPSTLDDLQALLDDAANMNDRITPSLGEASSDDYFLIEANYNSLPPEYQQSYTWTPRDYFFNSDWAKNYFPAYNSNFCLEALTAITKTDQNSTLWDNVKGSALFFRSYYFLNLTSIYSKAYDVSSENSDFGIVLRLTSDFNIPSQRSNLKETFERIIEDAKSSLLYLPTSPKHVFRPSRTAAYGLLARTYLFMRQYDSAFKYSNLSLSNNSQLLDYNNFTSFPQPNSNPEIIFNTLMNPSSASHQTSRALIDTFLYSSYDNNDLRKARFFTPSGNYRKFKGSYAASTTNFFTGIATDEMILTRAECYARSGNKDAALTDLNKLMIKRWKNSVPYPPITAIDPGDALAHILSERRKELLMRGLRWMDIKRLNKEGANIILKRIVGSKEYSLQPNANYYALPIPKDIIDQTGIPQNTF